MSPVKIAANLDNELPAIFVALNPRDVRALANRAGRPYTTRVDEILASFDDPRASNWDAPLGGSFIITQAGKSQFFLQKSEGWMVATFQKPAPWPSRSGLVACEITPANTQDLL